MASIGRFGGLFVVANLVCFLLFLFIQRLVTQATPKLPEIEVAGFVSIFRPAPQREQPTETQPEQQPQTEPEMVDTELSLSQQQITAFDAAETGLDLSGLTPGFGQGTASGNFEVADASLQAFAEDTREGLIEITPYSTRRPNIPKVAFDNKLNGWVLLVFNISESGQPINIKVLDAQPKGIFEDEVIKAIQRWRYSVSGLVRADQDVVLTQKIELQWQNYPANLPYND